jgi:GNAT superfamily N-acetyltransferase
LAAKFSAMISTFQSAARTFGRGPELDYFIETRSLYDPNDTEMVGISQTHYRMVLLTDQPHEDLVVANAYTFLVDPDLTDNWFWQLDGISSGGGIVADELRHCYETVVDAAWDDANDRLAANGRFVIVDDLNTPSDHRGRGYGFTLMKYVIEESLRNAVFVAWAASAYEESGEAHTERSSTLSLQYQARTGARPLSGCVLTLP